MLRMLGPSTDKLASLPRDLRPMVRSALPNIDHGSSPQVWSELR